MKAEVMMQRSGRKLAPLNHAPKPVSSKKGVDFYFKEHGITELLKDLTTDLAMKQPAEPIRYLHEMLGLFLGPNGNSLPGEISSNQVDPSSTSETQQMIRFHLECQGRWGSRQSHFVRRASTKHVSISVIKGWMQEAVDELETVAETCFEFKEAQALRRNLSIAGISDKPQSTSATQVAQVRDSIAVDVMSDENFDSLGKKSLVDHVVDMHQKEEFSRAASHSQAISPSPDLSNIPTPRETVDQLQAKNEEMMLSLFQKYDTNKTNKIDKTELVPILKRYAILNDEGIQQFLQNMNESDDLSFEDFKQLLQKTKNEVASLHLGKFDMDPNFRQGRFGDMTYFDNGIVYLLGTPDLQFLRAIYAEHCILKGSKTQFKAPNTGLRTTPYDEFFFVAGNIDTEKWELDVDEIPRIGEEAKGTREARPLREFMEHEYAVDAGLRPEELLVGRLYTGPMYYVYNRVVRTEVEKLWSGTMNTYTTTIHVLTSLLMKLSRVTKIERPWMVYRGMGNTILPEEFFAEDLQGCRGGVEFGFMSTTLDVSVALQYSGRDKGKQLPTVFEIEIGKTSMGSDVSWFSQFPQEKEILYPPLTHLEVIGDPFIANGVCLIKLRPTVNQNAQTLEQIEEENKTDLVQIAESLAMDMVHAANKANMDDTEAQALISKTEQNLLALINQHEASWYNDMGYYSYVFNEIVRKQEKGCRKVAEIAVSKGLELKQSGASRNEVIDTFSQAIDFWHLLPDSKERRDAILSIRKAIVEHLEADGIETDKLLLAKYKQRLGDAFKRRGEYSAALSEQAGVVELVRSEMGSQSAEAADALNEMAVLKRRLGQFDEALMDHVEAMNILEAVKGADHADVAKVAHNMGKVYHSLGRFFEALDSHQKALNIHQKAQHTLQIAATLSDIANVFVEQGNFNKAVKTFERVLTMRQQKLGEESKEVALSLAAMADVLQRQGKYDDALEKLQKATKILKKLFGKEHLEVATVVEKMGQVCTNKADFKNGIKYYEQALKMRQRIFGNEHLSVATTVSRIAWAMSCTGNYKEALEKYFLGISITREVMGSEHPEVARQLTKCGATYEKLGQFSDAMTAYEEAVKIQTTTFGDMHTSVAFSLDKIAGVYKKQGDFDQAMNRLEEAIRIRKKVLGNFHPDLGSSLLEMGDLFASQSWYDESLKRFVQAKEIFYKSLEADHPLIARVMFSMAKLHRDTGDFEQAIGCHDEALRIRKEGLGEDHPEVAESLENKAETLEKMGKLEDAVAAHNEALAIRIKALGAEHPDVAKSLGKIAMYHREKGEHSCALELELRVVQILEKVFGPGHLDVAASRLSVAQTYKELNRHLDAMEEYQAAHDIKLQILGDDHEDVTGLRERMESLRPMLVTPRGESQQDSNGQS